VEVEVLVEVGVEITSSGSLKLEKRIAPPTPAAAPATPEAAFLAQFFLEEDCDGFASSDPVLTSELASFTLDSKRVSSFVIVLSLSIILFFK
jgi:hypothetical protein